MSRLSFTVNGDSQSHLYGTFDNLGRNIDLTKIVRLSAGTSYTDITPFRIPRTLVLEEGSTLVVG